MVTRADIAAAMRRLGVAAGDVLLYHSSLKSFGQVEGGADAVIDGMLDALGKEGTLVAPTLVQRDFLHAYENWDRDTSPSDVGLISETLRRRPGARRSNQATHSCAAIGPLAEELTRDHEKVGPRIHIFGDYAFSYGSPWQKMYDRGGKVAFLGVSIEPNTYRHFVEARLIEKAVGAVKDEALRARFIADLARYPDYNDFNHRYDAGARYLIDPYIDGRSMLRMEPELEKRGLLRHATCGNAALTLMEVRPMVDNMEEIVRAEPDKYLQAMDAEWIKRVWEAGRV